jgi:putative transposase
MQKVKIYRIEHLLPKVASLIYEGQRDAARVWNFCKNLHKEARINHTRWASKNDLHCLTKGNFALSTQTVQQINQIFIANVNATRDVRKQNRKIRYPWEGKCFYPILFPAQALSIRQGRLEPENHQIGKRNT